MSPGRSTCQGFTPDMLMGTERSYDPYGYYGTLHARSKIPLESTINTRTGFRIFADLIAKTKPDLRSQRLYDIDMQQKSGLIPSAVHLQRLTRPLNVFLSKRSILYAIDLASVQQSHFQEMT